MADMQLWNYPVAVPAGTDVITFTTDPAVTPVLKTVSITDLAAIVGSGTPAGNPNEFQYNNGGVFGGTTGIEFGGANILIVGTVAGGTLDCPGSLNVNASNQLNMGSGSSTSVGSIINTTIQAGDSVFIQSDLNDVLITGNAGVSINATTTNIQIISTVGYCLINANDYINLGSGTTMDLTAGTDANITAADNVTITATSAAVAVMSGTTINLTADTDVNLGTVSGDVNIQPNGFVNVNASAGVSITSSTGAINITNGTGVMQITSVTSMVIDGASGIDINGNSLAISTNGIGVFGVAPVAQASAYTQTYATADKTVANDTAVDLATTAATQTTPWGFSSQAQADDLATQFNALRVDHENLKKVVNAIIDDHQAYGLFQ